MGARDSDVWFPISQFRIESSGHFSSQVHTRSWRHCCQSCKERSSSPCASQGTTANVIRIIETSPNTISLQKIVLALRRREVDSFLLNLSRILFRHSRSGASFCETNILEFARFAASGKLGPFNVSVPTNITSPTQTPVTLPDSFCTCWRWQKKRKRAARAELVLYWPVRRRLGPSVPATQSVIGSNLESSVRGNFRLSVQVGLAGHFL